MMIFLYAYILATQANADTVPVVSVKQSASSCELRLDASSNKSVLRAMLWPHPGLPTVDIYINAFDHTTSGPAIASSSDGTFRQQAFGSTVTAEGKEYIKFAIKNSVIDHLARGETIRLEYGATERNILFLSSPKESIGDLGRCERELIESWGVDRRRLRPVVLPGDPSFIDLSKLIVASYPEDAKERGSQGRVVALLTLSGSGTPEACKIVETAGDPLLDSTTCEIALHHGHYRPYQTMDGSLVKSWIMFPVRWTLTKR